MKLRFPGGIDRPDGAATLIEFEGFQILLECGRCAAEPDRAAQEDINFPFDPASLHSALFTRPHPYSCGNLPNLVKQGFGGMVFATMPAQDMAGAMLRDIACMRAEMGGADAFSLEDAERALYNFNGINYQRPFHLLRDVRCRFLDAGFLIGSAIAVIESRPETDRTRRLAYAGCLGPSEQPILRMPQVPADIHTLVLGLDGAPDPPGRRALAAQELTQAVGATIETGGKVLIPGFAFGRPLRALGVLHRAWESGALPQAHVIADSPLAVHVAESFRHHVSCYDSAVRARILEEHDPFGFARIECLRTPGAPLPEGPCVAIAPTETLQDGRARKRFLELADDPANLVVLPCRPPDGTLGGALAQGQTQLSIDGRTVECRARVLALDALGGGADTEELATFARFVAESGCLEKVCLIGASQEERLGLAQQIADATGADCLVAQTGDVLDV